MKDTKTIFSTILCRQSYIALSVLCAIFSGEAFAASVTARNVRANTTSRMPTMTSHGATGTTSTTKTETTKAESAPIVIDEEIVDTSEIIENKSSQFDEVLTDIDDATSDATQSTLADRIREQRALLDAADATGTATKQMQTALATGQNACDANLRACMEKTCGRNFSKCAGDTDTIWGDKMDRCRRDLPCTGEEYRLFATEIKADRDINARLAMFNEIVDCGNSYNSCIVEKCGTTYSKCLGKKSQDAAINACKQIAQKCISADGGLASRTMDVFGTLRVDAEKIVQRDEERLYTLRDDMRAACGRLGAMFDERTLDCVYTVNFFAGEDNTLYASKKAYAGSTFSCNQNWFGVDITTFMENAFRLTREQKSASSAMLGSGLGMGVGAITSGAIDRAVDRHKAEKALKDAEEEHDELYGDDDDEEDDKRPGAAQRRCEKAYGTWINGTCTDADCGANKEWDNGKEKCVKSKNKTGGGSDNTELSGQEKRQQKRATKTLEKGLEQQQANFQSENTARMEEHDKKTRAEMQAQTNAIMADFDKEFNAPEEIQTDPTEQKTAESADRPADAELGADASVANESNGQD